MGRKIDLTGQQFGMWTVLKESSQRDAAGGIMWECRCECGTIKNVAGLSLRKGKSTCCGCIKQNKSNSMIGQKFDMLTVIEKTSDRSANGSIQWKCLCDCGKTCIKSTTYLHRKDLFHSCGCYRQEQVKNLNKKDLVGQKFGKLLVLKDTGKRTDGGCIIWKCLCDCGNKTEVRTDSLTTGNTQSCGCINYSIGEKNIETILKNNKILFKAQYTCPELKLKKFDFAILTINGDKPKRLIEFDGEQHFKDKKGLWNSKETLQDIQKRDQEKNQWAKSHNIPLVRIPYWERDNITLDMLLGNKYLVK